MLEAFGSQQVSILFPGTLGGQVSFSVVLAKAMGKESYYIYSLANPGLTGIKTNFHIKGKDSEKLQTQSKFCYK